MDAGNFLISKTVLGQYTCCKNTGPVNISGLSDWALYNASTDVNMNSHIIYNVHGIDFSANAILNGSGLIINLSNINGSTTDVWFRNISAQNISANNMTISTINGHSLMSYTDEWAIHPAITNVDMSNNRISNISGIYFSDGSSYIAQTASIEIYSNDDVVIRTLSNDIIIDNSGIRLNAPQINASGAILYVGDISTQSFYTVSGIIDSLSVSSLSVGDISSQSIATHNISTQSFYTVSGIIESLSVSSLSVGDISSQRIATQNISTQSFYTVSGIIDSLSVSSLSVGNINASLLSISADSINVLNSRFLVSSLIASNDIESNTIHSNSIITNTVNNGIPYTTVNPQPFTAIYTTAGGIHGRILYVDISYGSDASAISIGKYLYPFNTLEQALAQSSAGDTIYLYPGVHTLSAPITIQKNISIRGTSVQTTFINYAATTSTALITIEASSRIEDVTINLISSTPALTLVGIDLSASSNIFKLRTAVLNISTTDISSTIIGVRSSGTNSTTYGSSDALRSSTINVDGAGSSLVRCIYVTGANRISARDVNMYAAGATTNAIAAEVVNASGVLYLRSCSCFGTKADISQPIGTIYLGSTDLVHSNANSYDFTTLFSPINVIYGTIGNISTDTYYLLPGTYGASDLHVINAGYITPSQCCVHHMSIMIQTNMNGSTAVFTLQKNGVDISGFSLSIPSGSPAGTYNTSNISMNFAKNDKISIKMIVLNSGLNNGQHPIVDLSIY